MNVRDYNSSIWLPMFTMGSESYFSEHSWSVTNGSRFISNGTVSLQITHGGSGIASHIYQIDYASVRSVGVPISVVDTNNFLQYILFNETTGVQTFLRNGLSNLTSNISALRVTGNCPTGYVVQNVTVTGIECVLDSSGNGTGTGSVNGWGYGGYIAMWMGNVTKVNNVTNTTTPGNTTVDSNEYYGAVSTSELQSVNSTSMDSGLRLMLPFDESTKRRWGANQNVNSINVDSIGWIDEYGSASYKSLAAYYPQVIYNGLETQEFSQLGMFTFEGSTTRPGASEYSYDACGFSRGSNYFDGVNDRINMSLGSVGVNQIGNLTGNSTFLVYTNIKTNSLNNQTILSRWSGSGAGFELRIFNGYFQAFLSNGSVDMNLTGTKQIIPNVWYSVAVGYDEDFTGYRLTVNGGDDYSALGGESILNSTDVFGTTPLYSGTQHFYLELFPRRKGGNVGCGDGHGGASFGVPPFPRFAIALFKGSKTNEGDLFPFRYCIDNHI